MGTRSRSFGRAAIAAAALALCAACIGGDSGPTYKVDVDRTSLSFEATQGGVLPAATIVTATFRGDGLIVGYPPGTAEPTWLSVTAVGSTSSSARISVRPSTTMLVPGTYRTTLRFVTGKQDGSAVVYTDLSVQYVVADPSYAIAVNVASVSLAADQGGPLPAPAIATVTYDGGFVAVGYPPGVERPAWLSAAAAASNGSGTVTIAPSTTSLAPGSYATTLRLSTGSPGVSASAHVDLPVQYVVSAGLRSSTPSLSFSAFDGTAPDAQSITLASDVFPRDWAATVEATGGAATDWLSVSPASGTLSSGSANVQVAAAARAPGSYAAEIVVLDGSGSERARIPVSYAVAPAFTVSGTLATRVTEAATLASLDLPLALHTQLDAAAGTGHLWQATTTADWLSVIPSAGDLSGDASLVVRLDPAKLWALANGTYAATVTIASTQGGLTTASVPVSLTVALSPALSAPASVSWTVGAVTAPGDLARSVTVSSNLGEAFADRGGWNATVSAPWLLAPAPAGSGTSELPLAVVPAVVETLPNGAHAATVTISPADARVAGDSVQASLQLALPDVLHVAPYLTWVGRGDALILRGSGFGTGGTLPVRFGADQVTGAVVSDTEVRVTAPTQAAAGRVAVSIPNTLGLTRAASELVVVAAPGYAPHEASFATLPQRMALDPERQAVLLFGYPYGEVRRFRFASGAWTADTFVAPQASGAAPSLDGKTLLVTSGTVTSSAQVFFEVDPATLAVRKQTTYPTYYEAFDLVAGFNDGRVLVLDSNQWCSTVWYPSLASGLYVDSHGAWMLVTRDRSRMIVAGSTSSDQAIVSYDVSDAAARRRTLTTRVWTQDDWSVSGDGGRLVIGTTVYDRDFAFVGTVALPETDVAALALSTDAILYTLARGPTGWVLRRTDVGGPGPFAAAATPLPLSPAPAAGENPVAMAVSEDGGTLFLLTHYTPPAYGSAPSAIFRAIPLN